MLSFRCCWSVAVDSADSVRWRELSRLKTFTHTHTHTHTHTRTHAHTHAQTHTDTHTHTCRHQSVNGEKEKPHFPPCCLTTHARLMRYGPLTNMQNNNNNNNTTTTTTTATKQPQQNRQKSTAIQKSGLYISIYIYIHAFMKVYHCAVQQFS